MQPPAIILFIGGYYLLFVLGLVALLYFHKAISGQTFFFLEATLLIIFGILTWYALTTAEDYLSTLLGINLIYMLVSMIILYLILPEHIFKSRSTNTEKAGRILVLGIIPLFFVGELWNLLFWGIQPLIIALALSLISMTILYVYRSVKGYLIALMILSFLFLSIVYTFWEFQWSTRKQQVFCLVYQLSL